MSMNVRVTLTAEQVADAFSELNDDEQARVFVRLAEISETWPAHARLAQYAAIGKHLRECECSTPGAREVIEEIHAAMRERV